MLLSSFYSFELQFEYLAFFQVFWKHLFYLQEV